MVRLVRHRWRRFCCRGNVHRGFRSAPPPALVALTVTERNQHFHGFYCRYYCFCPSFLPVESSWSCLPSETQRAVLAPILSRSGSLSSGQFTLFFPCLFFQTATARAVFFHFFYFLGIFCTHFAFLKGYRVWGCVNLKHFVIFSIIFHFLGLFSSILRF